MVNASPATRVLFLGDNNYDRGCGVEQGHDFRDVNITQFYPNKSALRPAVGNHDYFRPDAEPYVEYFNLPMGISGNDPIYYDFIEGPVHWYTIDTNELSSGTLGPEPLGGQKDWLRKQLAKSRTCWNLIYMHHAPWTSTSTVPPSGGHGSYPEIQWPYRA